MVFINYNRGYAHTLASGEDGTTLSEEAQQLKQSPILS